LGDERVELIARSAPAVLPEPEVIPIKGTTAAPGSIAPSTATSSQSAKTIDKPAHEAKGSEAKTVPPAPVPKAKDTALPVAKPTSKVANVVPVKAAPPAKAKPAAKFPVKAGVRAVAVKTGGKKPAVLKSAKAAPIKSANIKAAQRPVKAAPKSPAKPALKKAVVKKAVGSKLRKVVAKPRPAKAIVKSKPAAGKAKTAIKKKVVAKPAKKAAPAKKKR
jgi:hypothetical protein